MTRTKKPAQPASLNERLIAQENERHQARLTAIKRADSMLRMFEPTFLSLVAKGIHIALDNLYVNYTRSLHVSAGSTCSGDHRIYDALIDLGFKEVKRDTTSIYAHCILKKSRLQVYLMIEAAHQYTKPEAK